MRYSALGGKFDGVSLFKYYGICSNSMCFYWTGDFFEKELFASSLLIILGRVGIF